MCPACPSTDKVPDIAAVPVNGNPALTPDNPEPSPVKEPVKEPVIFEEATVPAFLKLRPVIVPSLELMWELAVIWPLGPWKHAAPDTVKSSPCVSAKLSVVPIVCPTLP